MESHVWHGMLNPLSHNIHIQILWSPYISLNNYLKEFGKRSNIFLVVIILLILIDFAHDSLWISLGEN